jgi:hypothetical protein
MTDVADFVKGEIDDIEMPSLDGYATETYVNNTVNTAVGSIVIPGLPEDVLKDSDVYSATNTTGTLATKTYVDSVIPDATDYLLKSEVISTPANIIPADSIGKNINLGGTLIGDTNDNFVAIGGAVGDLYTTSIGSNAKAIKPQGTALGYCAQATTSYSTALGSNSIGGDGDSDTYATAVGCNNQTTKSGNTAIGGINKTLYAENTIVGFKTEVNAGYATAIGANCKANAGYAVALGYNCQSTGGYSIAIGRGCTASANTSIAIGNNITAATANSITIGADNITSIKLGPLVIQFGTGTTVLTKGGKSVVLTLG